MIVIPRRDLYTQRTRWLTRPAQFRINPNHPLARGLLFAGLGRYSASDDYHDSSVYNRPNKLVKMDKATDWLRVFGRNALDFDGVDDYVLGTSFADNPDVLTISLFAKFPSNSQNLYRPVLGRLTDQATGEGWSVQQWFSSSPTNLSVTIQGPGGTNYVTGRATYSANTWQHVCAAFWKPYSFANVRMYKDGQPLTLTNNSSGTVTDCASSSPLYIGNMPSATWIKPFAGQIADVLIHDRLLSTSELLAIADPFNVTLSLNGSDPGLLIEESPPEPAKAFFMPSVIGSPSESPSASPSLPPESQPFKLQYRKVGTSTWYDVPVLGA